jgi:hypothetical protein
VWAHQDLNLGPPDYESGAANQLSYRPYDISAMLRIASERSANVGVFLKCPKIFEQLG